MYSSLRFFSIEKHRNLWYNINDSNHCFSVDNNGLDNFLITGVRQHRIGWIIGIKLSN